MSWEQRSADFCKAQTDAQMTYIEAEREVDQLETENAELRELVQAIGYYCVNAYCEPGDGCPLLIDGRCTLSDRMHELGVEVEQ